MATNKVKVLIIANSFPPPINGGNIRIYKFVKYFLKHNWEVFLLTRSLNKNSEDINALFSNEELVNLKWYDVSDLLLKYKKYKENKRYNITNQEKKNNIIYKIYLKKLAKKIEKYFIPDIYRYTWVKNAFDIAKTIIVENQIKNIITTSPPHSTQLIGFKLKKYFNNKIKWIADFRDLWSLSPVFDMYIKNKFISLTNKIKEKKCYKYADSVVFVSKEIANISMDKFRLEKHKLYVITNGFDEEDFQGQKRGYYRQSNKIIFSYIGSIFGPRLNNKLVEAFNSINNKNVMIRFVGAFDDSFRMKVLKLKNAVVESMVSHEKAIQIMLESNCLIMILTNDLEGKIAFTGKFFEYIRAKRPILALVPEGEVSNIIRNYNMGEISLPDKVDDIVNAVMRIIKGIEKNKYIGLGNKELLNKYNRESLTKELEKLFIE